jgi:chromosome segregation ATPase
MARVNHKTILEEQNAQAHLEILRKEIGDITAPLKELADKRESLRVFKESISSEIEDLISKRDVLLQSLQRLNSIISQKEQDIANEQHWGQKELDELRNHKIVLSQEINTLTSNFVDQKSNLSDILTSLECTIEDRSYDLKKINNQIEQADLKLCELNGIISSLQESHNSNVLDSENYLSNLNQQIVDTKIELAHVKVELESYKQSVSVPAEQIMNERLLLQRERRDLDIYKSRVRAAWRKAFPERPMII